MVAVALANSGDRSDTPPASLRSHAPGFTHSHVRTLRPAQCYLSQIVLRSEWNKGYSSVSVFRRPVAYVEPTKTSPSPAFAAQA